MNLLFNAIKYTDEGYIALNAIYINEKTIKISVKDTGTGIPLHL